MSEVIEHDPNEHGPSDHDENVEVQRSELLDRPLHLCIATPAYGSQVTLEYHNSIIRTLEFFSEKKIPVSILNEGGDSFIQRCRNRLVTKFLEDERYSHLIWIDADLGFEPEAIMRLVMSGKHVVSGVYPYKRLFWNTGATTLPKLLRYPLVMKDGAEVDDLGFLEVDLVAGGFQCIRREALENMAAHYPELKFESDMPDAQQGEVEYGFYDSFREGTHALTEDYAFQRRWQEMGGSVFVDVYAKLNHTGAMVYPGDMASTIA